VSRAVGRALRLTLLVRLEPVEITDLLWSIAPDGNRDQVSAQEVLAALRKRGQRRAARIVSRFPTRDGALDPAYVDALAVRVHCELQRLGEELQFGRRVAALLTPLVEELRHRATSPVTIVDVGCGLGYVIRSLAARREFGDGVELLGVDRNPILAEQATRLSQAEDLQCRFVFGDALAPGGAIEQSIQIKDLRFRQFFRRIQ